MNIVYLHTHDLGDWLSVYGREVASPHLDALARESTLFGDAHAVAPTCSPSRAAMLTGQCAHKSGMLGLAHRGFALKNPQHHIANVLCNKGYETVLSGIQHEFANSQASGFPYQTVLNHVVIQEDETHASFQRRRDREVAESVVDWLENRQSKRNFFLSVGFFQPHRPFPERDAEDDPAMMSIPPLLPQEAEVKEDLAALRTSIRLLDNAVGMVIEALKRKGLWDQSIIFFTTDHGIAFPLHKCCLTDAGTKVALMLRHPEKLKSHGCRIDGLVSHLDVVPTLYDWLGMSIPEWCEGFSLGPLIEGRQPIVRKKLFGEVTFHAAYEPMRSIRTSRYCFVRRFAESRWLLSNIDDSLTKDAWLKNGCNDLLPPEFELYDLERDQQQLNNVAGHSNYREIRAELEADLQAWMEESEDPLLQGIVKRPLNSIINHPDSTSPHQCFYEETMVMS